MASLTTARLNETFELLTHPHRRFVLYHLKDTTGPVSIGTLATAIADWDANHPDGDRAQTADDIETALYHTHIPKLAEAGFITNTPRGDAVELVTTDGLEQFLSESAAIDGREHVTEV